ncbi:MAG: hypothetical protein HRU19_13155 [Pseudobacteriovorax sp.]|nr:hypothetical protein [Pseudobacteriovorax sp.]
MTFNSMKSRVLPLFVLAMSPMLEAKPSKKQGEERSIAVQSVEVDTENELFVFQVSYAGGCEAHKFQIDTGSCQETFPVSCPDARLRHFSNDTCKAIVSEEVTISFEEAGIDSYYSEAGLVFQGRYELTLPAID